MYRKLINICCNPTKHEFMITRYKSNVSVTENKQPYRAERLPLDPRQKRLYPQVEQEFTDEGFPILKLKPSKRRNFDERKKMIKRRESRFNYLNRSETMKEDIDWPSTWPTAKTFVPSAIPLPLRQSFEEKEDVPRGKFANTELLKIANFLHLTPKAIERHCKALSKFCTEWPEGLDSDEDVRYHFPITYVTRDYCHSSSTIRDVRARVVQLKINMDDLKLEPLDKDKLIRLSGHRYDRNTNILCIETSDCPTKVQNEDYANYLLTALYFESIKHDKWEEEKPECDWERFYWTKSKSKQRAKEYMAFTNPNVPEDVIEAGIGNETIHKYKESLEKIFENENYENLEEYRRSVEDLVGLRVSK